MPIINDHQKKEDQIQSVLQLIDFEKIHAFMVFTNHTWHMGSEGLQVPDIDHIRYTATDLLRRCAEAKEESYSAGTGGFNAIKLRYGLSLTFSPIGFRGASY